MQVGQGVPATRSGLIMLALMFGMISSSAVCGQLVTRVGKLKPFMLAGGLLLIAGVTSLCFIGPDTSTQGLVWRLLLVGVGLGPGQSLFSLAVQNTVPFYQLGVATSSGQFVRQIGQTMGVALFGALLTAGLSSELRRHEPAAPASAVVHHLDLSDLQRMAMQRSLHPELAPARAADPAARAMDRDIRESFSVAIVHGMFFSLATLIVGFIIMLLIPEGRLRERRYDALPAALASSEPDDGAAMAAEHAGEELKL
jgi:MFS family permease